MAIQRLNNGKYKINVYIGKNLPRFIAYADTGEEAEIVEAEAKLRKKKGEKFTRRRRIDTFEATYEEWWVKKYTATTGNSQATLDNTERYFRLHILPYIGDIEISKIDYSILEDLQNLWAFGDKEKKIKPIEKYKVLRNYTSKVLAYAVVKGYRKYNPFDNLDIPYNKDFIAKREHKRSSKYYSKEDILRTMEAMKKDYGLQGYVLLALLYSVGATKGEIYPLTWEDVDLENKYLNLGHRLVIDKKTRKQIREVGMKNSYRFRTVPLSDEVVKLLEIWKVEQQKELSQINIVQSEKQYLFTYTEPRGDMNQPLRKDWLNRKLNILEKKYNLPHIVPHGLRHTFISNSIMIGIDDMYLKSIVGHAEMSNVTRNVYGHINKEKQQEVVQEMSKFNSLKEIEEPKKEYEKSNKIIHLVTKSLPNDGLRVLPEKRKL